MSFPPATEMFQFAGFAAPSYGSLDATACAVGCPIRRSEDHRALAPPLGFSQRATSFIASRCQGIHQMPFFGVVRAQPRARGGAACRSQSSDVRRRSSPALRCRALPSDLRSLISVLWDRARTPRPMLAHRPHAYPCPGPTSPPGSPPRPMAGPASRSQLASRCHKNTGGQRAADRPQGVRRARSPSQLAAPRPEDLGGDLPLSAVVLPHHACLVGLGRFERPTSRLSGVRSDQLSYRPKIRDQRTAIRRPTKRRGVNQGAAAGSVL